MNGQHQFISYSSADALDFAYKLHDMLEAGPPHIPAWLDKRDIKPERDWDTQIDEGIANCLTLLFVMTHDSVEDQSICKLEWSRALRYKKSVVPLLVEKGVKVPFRLESRQYIDFADNFEQGMARLRQHIEFLKSPAGELQRMKDQHADAHRDLRRTNDALQIARIQDEIAHLGAEIKRLQAVVDDPSGAARRTQASIEAGLERVRQPASAPRMGSTKFINPPPGLAPDYFQDRHVETKLVADFLNNPAQRLLTLVGRGGVGKTAMICRLLKGLELGQLPDDLGPMQVDGIVYLSAIGSRRVTFPNLYADLGKLLPQNIADELDALYREPQVSATVKTQNMLNYFPDGCFVVLLDNMEDGIDPETRHLTDSELDEALRAILDAPHHGVNVILTTRLSPRQLRLHQPGRQRQIELDEGLESPYAENILRAMDADGKLGLKSASDALLNRARERTRGYPRALEALAAILAADREITLEEVLDSDLPENVVEALVGQAFSRLDATAQYVMQALAIFGRPVPAVAVDYLLQPYQPGIDSAGTLGRLVGMHFARREGGQYFLHPIDEKYVLSLLPETQPLLSRKSRDTIFEKNVLYRKASRFFRKTRTENEAKHSIEDVRPELSEFELLVKAGDFDDAANLINRIDFDYLLTWGYATLVVNAHTNLVSKLTRPNLLGMSWSKIALSYRNLGRYDLALTATEKSLNVARQAKDKKSVGRRLGSLGTIYRILGKFDEALTCYEEALAISREIIDERGESNRLGNLGHVHQALGNYDKAIEYFESSYVIDKKLTEMRSLALGQEMIGHIHLEKGDIPAAVRQFQSAISLATGMNFIKALHYSYFGLALAGVFSHQLEDAAKQIDKANIYDDQENNHVVKTLHGIILSQLGDFQRAVTSFREAYTDANNLVQFNPDFYAGLDTKGLALTGLGVVQKKLTVLEQEIFSQAILAYRAARAITSAKGIVNRVLRLHDALTVVAEGDAELMAQLAEVRKAAAGEA